MRRLDQDQESRGAGSTSRGRGGLGPTIAAGTRLDRRRAAIASTHGVSQGKDPATGPIGAIYCTHPTSPLTEISRASDGKNHNQFVYYRRSRASRSGRVMSGYDAFISYSHAKDKPIAAALQAAIQRLGKPWYRRRALRLFRDDTSLSATPNLWPSIERALGQSGYLILLASPEAAASPWVAKELLFWLDQKSAGTLLIGLTDGEIAYDDVSGDFRWADTTCLPSVLVGRL